MVWTGQSEDRRMNQELDELVEVIGRTCGRDISPYDAAFLTKSLAKRLTAIGCGTAAAYFARLAGDPAEAEVFCRSLHITYSEFFRNPLAFALLEALILPSLAQERGKMGRPEIRVWSAGCAGGQEAYSVAILLDELAAPCRIFASDIAADELAVAQTGVYTAAALQNVRVRHLHNYVVQHGDSYSIIPRLRDRVDFSLYDLLDPRSTCPPASIYGDFDLVFCSNVLIYYRPDVRQAILDKLRCCLAPAGYLVTGEAERASIEQAGGFAPVAPPAAVFQRTKGFHGGGR
jgi:chemotaxis protein methyltransferase CheR